MHIVLSSIAVLILLGGVVFNRLQIKEETPSVENTRSEVLSQRNVFETSTEKETQADSDELVDLNEETSQSIFDISSPDYLYPNATIISQTINSTELQTQDNPKLVTDWYKEKISETGFTTTSFVTTSTNGEVVNKLSAVKNDENVVIEITKKSDQLLTLIKIDW